MLQEKDSSAVFKAEMFKLLTLKFVTLANSYSPLLSAIHLNNIHHDNLRYVAQYFRPFF